MNSKNKAIQNIFEEISTWENVPINRVLGSIGIDKSSSVIKRIIMCGATQVGKTTVVMALLGIKNDKQAELERILRGGTTAGHSSTSATVVYMKSADSNFGYYEGGIEETIDESKIESFSPEVFEAMLGKLKEEKRTDSLKSIYSASYIYIPKDYFNKNAPNLQIVDSRGFGERIIETERGDSITSEKINKFIDDLMLFASGVVAVATVDKMQSLKSDYKAILDKKSPNQVLIILTHALVNNREMLNMLAYTENITL